MCQAIDVLQKCLGDTSSADVLCSKLVKDTRVEDHERVYPADHNGWKETITCRDDSKIIITVTPHPPIK